MNRIDELKIIITELHFKIGNKAYHDLKPLGADLGDCSRSMARLEELQILMSDLKSSMDEYLKLKQ